MTVDCLPWAGNRGHIEKEKYHLKKMIIEYSFCQINLSIAAISDKAIICTNNLCRNWNNWNTAVQYNDWIINITDLLATRCLCFLLKGSKKFFTEKGCNPDSIKKPGTRPTVFWGFLKKEQTISAKNIVD